MKLLFRMACWLALASSSVAVCQDGSKAGGKTMDTMAAKKTIMDPSVMDPAKKAMMSEKSMLPTMVSKEMTLQSMMQDKEMMGMVSKGAMTEMPEEKKMMNDEKMMMAGEKLMKETSQMQQLFQELVARHIAAKKMAMMAKNPTDTSKLQPAKAMMMDEKMMMDAKKEMVMSDATPMMMAREELIRSLMLDNEVMAVIEKESQMMKDPKMASMMSDEKMMMAGEAMLKDKDKMKSMAQEGMMRQMSDSKKSAAKKK